MRNRTARLSAAAILLSAAAGAKAEPVSLTIDPSRSQISVTITAVVLGPASDTETSAVTGTLDVCLNDPEAPTIVLIEDLDAALSSNLNFLLNYALLGTVSATATNASAAYAAQGVATGPVPVGPTGMFAFTAPDTVPVNLTGTLQISGTGVVGGVVGMQTQDLASLGVFPAEFAATVSDDGSTLTVSGQVAFAGTNNDLGIEVTSSGTLTVVATAPLTPGGCVCDFDCAAGVNVFDLLAYLDEWFAGAPAAEMTGDAPASVDVFDLLAFLDCWFPAAAGAC